MIKYASSAMLQSLCPLAVDQYTGVVVAYEPIL